MSATPPNNNDDIFNEFFPPSGLSLSDDMTRLSAVHMHVTAAADSPELKKLVTIAERACIAANTIRAAVALTVS